MLRLPEGDPKREETLKELAYLSESRCRLSQLCGREKTGMLTGVSLFVPLFPSIHWSGPGPSRLYDIRASF